MKFHSSKSEANDYFFYSFVGTVVYGHGQLKNANNKICAAISFLADGAFLIVCNKLLMTIACSSTNTLLPNSDIICWEGLIKNDYFSCVYIKGTHQGYAAIALVMFAYYVPLCVMIAPIFMHSGQDEKDIVFSESYVMTLTTMKCVMLIFSVFFSQTASGMVLASVFVYLVLFIATMIWAIRAHNKFTEPSTFPFVNMFKIAGFFAACNLKGKRNNKCFFSVVRLCCIGGSSDRHGRCNVSCIEWSRYYVENNSFNEKVLLEL